MCYQILYLTENIETQVEGERNSFLDINFLFSKNITQHDL